MSYFNEINDRTIICSYGIIAYTKKNNKIYYLMIQRNNTFGFIDIVKGKYNHKSLVVIKNLIHNMTKQERESIKSESFVKLWHKMWKKHTKICRESQELFEQNRNYFIEIINELENSSHDKWNEPEWEFPKGRKNVNETELSCAIREFSEETGIHKKDINIIENIFPYEEYNIGTNFKPYKFKYYLAYIADSNIDISHFQDAEVSNLKWFTYEECLKRIRNYHFEKKENLSKINHLINLI